MPGESNLPFLFAVYTISWLAFFAYAFYMTRRQRELRREIEELRQQQESKGPA
ncbi:MAG: CcmD family protein [Chloroflexi bacterium]|nr:CcmD family protein [Chloroflexota bacterium]